MSRCQTLHNGKQHNSIRYNSTRKRTTPETLYMLGLVEKILPFGSNLWNAVELQYYTKLRDGFPVCDAESINASSTHSRIRASRRDIRRARPTLLKPNVYIVGSKGTVA
ncbi:hypothetical protein F444_20018 [Phytophthora nicotianae P1976]|uniref:Uncharacterized protein n=1 Tax=Phytophthora nicotianae P1976 TaxID=1317066 RepID=A0A080Z5X8_PHYNI|nr:hypothetical protein F444_20018 [Phytophthora nicotianae P1976]